jgi:hypothetical protein
MEGRVLLRKVVSRSKPYRMKAKADGLIINDFKIERVTSLPETRILVKLNDVPYDPDTKYDWRIE